MGSSGRIITTADILDRTILPADLYAGGTPDRVMGTTDGANAAWGQLTAGMAGPRALNASSLYGGGTANRVLTSGTAGLDPLWGQIVAAMIAAGVITSNEIADGTIMNADINAAALIAYSKMQALTIGLVKSNGATLTGGNQIVSADITDGTIATVDLAAAAVHTVATPVVISPTQYSGSAQNNMTGASIVLTTQGGPVLVLLLLWGAFNTTGVGTCTVQLWTDGAQTQNLMITALNSTQTQNLMGFDMYTPSGSPGAPVAHTLQITWGTTVPDCKHAGGFLAAFEMKR